jgi:hypothetical protein
MKNLGLICHFDFYTLIFEFKTGGQKEKEI